ncbi:MAG: PfkB family carbohydrate kinase [Clostridiaceae bacterium]
MIKVIGIGDNVCDQYYPAKIMYPGGQAMNFSVYAKMLGAQSAYLGVFGKDRVAEHIISVLDEIGVDHSRCRQYAGENGYAKVRLENGDRQFIMSNRGGIVNEHPLDLKPEDISYIREFSLVHTSNNGHFDSQLKKVRETGIPVSYDFSGHWNEEYYLKEIAPVVDYAFFSCGEIDERPQEGEHASAFVSEGCKIAVATMGKRGSLAFDGKKYYRQIPKPVDAIDTLGAGDSFTTAFLLSTFRWRKNRDSNGKGS